jgi:hypothetical protein
MRSRAPCRCVEVALGAPRGRVTEARVVSARCEVGVICCSTDARVRSM